MPACVRVAIVLAGFFAATTATLLGPAPMTMRMLLLSLIDSGRAFCSCVTCTRAVNVCCGNDDREENGENLIHVSMHQAKTYAQAPIAVKLGRA